MNSQWGGTSVRRAGVALGAAALLAVAGCGGDAGSDGAAPGTPPILKTKATEDEPAGFDECGLVDPDEIAEAIGVAAMHVTGRAVTVQDDGSRRASCTYFPEDVPGILGMQLSTVVDTDPGRFFAPFADNFSNIETIPNLGDRAEAVAYGANGTSTHYIEIRVIQGDVGLHFYYSYSDEAGGTMPKADGSAAAVILTRALEQLPDEVTIPDGTPEGACTDIDLEPAAEAVGAELVMARSVLSEKDAVNCYFSGDDGHLDVTLITNQDRARRAAVTPDQITHPDLGDGARLIVTEANSLTAFVNMGDQVMVVGAGYADTVTELRPADVELVRSLVDTIGGKP
jgi:hypothetical protein